MIVNQFDKMYKLVKKANKNPVKNPKRSAIQSLVPLNKNLKIVPLLINAQDQLKLETILETFKVDTVYHSAAYKHVPLMEENPSEAIQTNVYGTKILADLSNQFDVQKFVMISTDKAVNPTNVMGASKRAAEMYVQSLFHNQIQTGIGSTKFITTRFGNVLGSNGSVVPLFKKQIEKGGPVTITHPDIIRYFMTIPEACQLVLEAGAMGKGGDVFVLDMGEPVRIYDLATKMIQLSGLQVLDEDNLDGDIEIKYIGLRPGEKLYEELLVGDNTFETDNKLIMKAKEIMINWSDLEPMLIQLREAALSSNRNKSQVLLQNIVPEFSPKSN